MLMRKEDSVRHSIQKLLAGDVACIVWEEDLLWVYRFKCAFVPLDPGELNALLVQGRPSFWQTSIPAWVPSLFSHSPQPERLDDLYVKNLSQLAGSGPVLWQQPPSFFGSIPPSEMHSRVPCEFDNSTAKNKLSAGDRIAVSSMERRKIEDFSEMLQDIPKNGTAAYARGRNRLLTGQELQQISEAVETSHAEPQQKHPRKELSTSQPRHNKITLDAGEDVSFLKNDEAVKKLASQVVVPQNADILKDHSHSQLSCDSHQLLVLVLQNQAVMAQNHSVAVQEIMKRLTDKESLEKKVSELGKAQQASDRASKAEVEMLQIQAENYYEAVKEILDRQADKESLEDRVLELKEGCHLACDRASKAEIKWAKAREELASAKTRLDATNVQELDLNAEVNQLKAKISIAKELVENLKGSFRKDIRPI